MSISIPKKGNILLVDNSPENLRALMAILAERGHQVRSAQSEEAALQRIGRDAPDLVVLDVSMAGTDGFEVCRWLKESIEYRDIPIISIVSTPAGPEDKSRAFRSGCVDTIQRPFTADAVLARVESHLRLSFHRKTLEQTAARLKHKIERTTEEVAWLKLKLRKEVEERKQAEETLHRRIDFDGVMTRVLSDFATCALHDIDTSVTHGLGSIALYIGAEQAYVLAIPSDRRTFSCTHEWCAPHISSARHKYQNVPLGMVPWAAKKILSGEVIRIDSLNDYPPEAVHERLFQQEDGAVSVLEIPIRNATGQIAGLIGVRAHTHPATWSEDDVLRLSMIGDTIASLLERQRVETALRDREERFRLSLDGSNVGVWDWDIPAGEAVYFRHWAEMLGYAEEEIDNSVGSWERLLHPDDKERVKGALEDHLEGKTSLYETGQRVLAKSGEWRWLLFRGRVIKRDEAGTPLRAVGVHVDVTERKMAEERLRASEEKFRELAESVREVFWIRTPDELLYISPAYTEIWGKSCESFTKTRPLSWTTSTPMTSIECCRCTWPNVHQMLR